MDDEPGGADDEEHHERVHRVAARGQDGDREHRKRQRTREAGTPPEDAPDEVVEERHRGGAGERLGQLERDRVEAEQLDACDLEPKVHRGLVDGDPPARFEHREEEVVPREGHAAHSRVVERVGRDFSERVEAQDAGHRRHRGDAQRGDADRQTRRRGARCHTRRGGHH